MAEMSTYCDTCNTSHSHSRGARLPSVNIGGATAPLSYSTGMHGRHRLPHQGQVVRITNNYFCKLPFCAFTCQMTCSLLLHESEVNFFCVYLLYYHLWLKRNYSNVFVNSDKSSAKALTSSYNLLYHSVVKS